jgi:hypothetical protein
LFAEIRAAQAELGERVDRRGTEPVQPQSIVVDLDRFAASLKTAWREGERRPTHRRPYRRRKPIPKRPSMLDDVKDQILTWLDREPAISALEIMRRLTSAHPERFADRHLRTVQRAVKAWRGQQARRIILEGAILLGVGVCAPPQAGHVTPPPPAPHPRGATTGAHSSSPRIAASDS